MTAFHKQSFQSRFATMGDPAEAAFDQVNPKAHPLGLNRPPFTMVRMTAAMRYTPDRMTADAFVECMGIGRDHTLKIKHEKLVALREWTKLGPVELFVYDQADNQWFAAPIESWITCADTFGVADVFPEGKDYYRIHRRDFPCDPNPLASEN